MKVFGFIRQSSAAKFIMADIMYAFRRLGCDYAWLDMESWNKYLSFSLGAVLCVGQYPHLPGWQGCVGHSLGFLLIGSGCCFSTITSGLCCSGPQACQPKGWPCGLS